jgi:hypothetical protein
VTKAILKRTQKHFLNPMLATDAFVEMRRTGVLPDLLFVALPSRSPRKWATLSTSPFVQLTETGTEKRTKNRNVTPGSKTAKKDYGICPTSMTVTVVLFLPCSSFEERTGT